MEPESRPTPYAFLYDLIVQHVSRASDDARFLWLEYGQLEHVIPHLTSNQVPLLFATELISAAYLHGNGRDTSLRQLITLLQETFSGHPEIVSELEQLLSNPNLGRLLFPSGLSVTDTETLMRAKAHFLRMPDAPDDPLPHVSPLPPPHHMRMDRNIDFVGREAEMREIARSLKQERGVVVAAGIGGVGKTQSAIEWVHRYGQFFAGGVFWLDFRDADTARLSIATAGIAYGWDTYSALDLDTQIAKVRRQWNEPIPTLLIFDNCEDVHLAYQYLPVGSGAKVLLTSRDTTWEAQAGNRGILQVEIVTLPRTDSIALLKRLFSALQDSYADEIAELVGDLPLALHLAGSYLAKYAGTSFGEPAIYLAALRANLVPHLEASASRLKRRTSPTSHTLSVRGTFELSWDRLHAQSDSISELAETLLGLLAHFAPGVTVPERWFYAELPEGADEMDAVDAIELLQSNGLVEQVQVGEVRLHRLIAEIVREKQSETTKRGLGQQGDRILTHRVPSYGNPDYIAQMEVWLPHALYRRRDIIQRHDTDGARLLEVLGTGLHNLTKYADAIECHREALMIRRAVSGERHKDTAMSLNSLARAYEARGEYGHALPLFEEALVIDREVLGARHPDTVVCLNNLASLYLKQGNYERALSFYEEALAINREVLGEQHPHTATSLNNLGHLYLVQGAYEQARPLLEEAVLIRKEVLGEQHPSTATSLSNLAGLYQELGDTAHALPLHEEALAIQQQTLGKRHPAVARSLNNLAGLYQTQGTFEQALRLYENALDIWREVFGSQHPNNATILNNLAVVYRSHGKFEHALPLFEEALSIQRDVSGMQHPTTATILYNLAEAHRYQRAYERALPLYEKSLTIFSEVLGQNHSRTQIVQGARDQCRLML